MKVRDVLAIRHQRNENVVDSFQPLRIVDVTQVQGSVLGQPGKR